MDPLEPFKTGGYTTLLVGMAVPYRNRHRPSVEEAAWFANWRKRNKRVAVNAITVKEALAAVHSPEWTWGRWGSGRSVYLDQGAEGAVNAQS